MFFEKQIWVGNSDENHISVLPKMANRHGLIAGATGTGKTITLKVLAESFSDYGVPVFLADVKGDLAGMCLPGEDSESMQKRIEKFAINQADFQYRAYPTCFWDIFGQQGLPLRTTVSEMGPTLLANLMELNQTQSDILSIIFRIADDQGLLLLDIKDLKAMLQYVGDHSGEFTTQYGNITKQSIGAIVRGVIALEELGGDRFFGEPALDIRDWFSRDMDGRGMINILHCASLINNQKMYATFMLWMLSELFEIMPEAGDLDKPKMVFFFDEAHLLFDDAPKALLQKIEQVVKLIRSKGLGIYFISQSPSDIPDEVLSQLGNRIQHALRAYTPSDQKAVKAAAQSFRPNPEFDTAQVITELGIGQALISFLTEDGSPDIVRRCSILPPQSKMGAIDESVRRSRIAENLLSAKYATSQDRDSAYEFMERKRKQDMENEAKEQAEEEERKEEEAAKKAAEKAQKAVKKKTSGSTRHRQTAIEKAANSAMSSIGREVGRSLFRGLMNNLKFK